MTGQELLQSQKNIIQLNDEIKILQDKKKEISNDVLKFLKIEKKDRIKSPIGTSYIVRRRAYRYSSDIEVLKEEISFAKKDEEKNAISEIEFEALKRIKGDTDVAFYKENETLSFRKIK